LFVTPWLDQGVWMPRSSRGMTEKTQAPMGLNV
jgi:hypothetical protein